MSYARFGAMIAVSTVAMYCLMFVNSYAVDHVFFSQTRAWTALGMGATMAIIMLLFMLDMYSSRRLNLAIVVGSALILAGALWLLRSHATVGDAAYMKAMIPHHSIAIQSSERARLRDPRVRALADQIIESQRREIDEMKRLITDLEQNPPPSEAAELASQRQRVATPGR